jgi:sulfate transport system permease protein
MAAALATPVAARRIAVPVRSSVRQESALTRRILIGLCVGFILLFLATPLLAVFFEAFKKGLGVYLAAFQDSAAQAAILLTLEVAMMAVTLNTVFGLAAAWAVTKFRFRGKQVFITLIDLPFAVSPVIAGLSLILIFGSEGWLGPWCEAHDIHIVFNTPGIVLATCFVSFPFVAREIIPLMQAQGSSEEEAALSLGANGWQIFRRVTLPNIKWALLHGVILCNARAMGEFGAVSVVSGHIRGKTNTIPLHIEVVYNDYEFSAAFAIATLLTFLALVTLVAKAVLERFGQQEAA